MHAASHVQSPRGFQRGQNLVFQPVLQGDPEDAQAKVAERESAEGVDPAEQGRMNPAPSPEEDGTDDDAPENRAEKEAGEEERELPAGHAGGHHAAPQAGPEREPDGISQAKDNAGREVSPRTGFPFLGGALAGEGFGERQPGQAEQKEATGNP